MDRGGWWATGHGATNFRTGRMIRDKERHYIKTKSRFSRAHDKPNNEASEHVRPTLAEPERETRDSSVMDGGCITTPPRLTGPAD